MLSGKQNELFLLNFQQNLEAISLTFNNENNRQTLKQRNRRPSGVITVNFNRCDTLFWCLHC